MILLGVGCESHDAVHALYKRRFSQAWPCPVTSHSVSSCHGLEAEEQDREQMKNLFID